MVTHAILSLEPLLADGTGVRLLIRMGQSMPVQMVHVSERLSTGLTSMVLPYRIGVWVGSCVYWQRVSYRDRYLDRGGIIEVVVGIAIWCSLKKKENLNDFVESERFYFSE